MSGVGTWALGVTVALSFNVWSDFLIFDKTIFDLLDYLTANIMLPIGGFGIAIFAGWVMHKKDVMAELDLSEKQVKIWFFLIRYITPGAVFLVLLDVIGVL
jgi:NSS family neurotransmitter:Na+ symporter